uniref:Proteasome activator PA28 C-terminal domain-containing protein n=1 Tax=Monodon monoceros TaxID=40151 RepID=A0A8C6C209_MONMO
MTTLHSKPEGFHTQTSKYFSERAGAMTKAAKQPHVGDYRRRVHQLGEAESWDIRLMVMEIREAYPVFYDIILKNFEKLKKPRGETKGMIYWPPLIFCDGSSRDLPDVYRGLQTFPTSCLLRFLPHLASQAQ